MVSVILIILSEIVKLFYLIIRMYTIIWSLVFILFAISCIFTTSPDWEGFPAPPLRHRLFVGLPILLFGILLLSPHRWVKLIGGTGAEREDRPGVSRPGHDRRPGTVEDRPRRRHRSVRDETGGRGVAVHVRLLRRDRPRTSGQGTRPETADQLGRNATDGLTYL